VKLNGKPIESTPWRPSTKQWVPELRRRLPMLSLDTGWGIGGVTSTVALARNSQTLQFCNFGCGCWDTTNELWMASSCTQVFNVGVINPIKRKLAILWSLKTPKKLRCRGVCR
jgi:alpha-D-ribose 1-methylphosphonate 5-phosphate C-P lyase